MSILVIVEGQKMRIASHQPHFVAGSSKFVRFDFEFSDDWNGLATHAIFLQDGTPYGGLFTNGSVHLPRGIHEGECKFTLWGYKAGSTESEDVRATTNYITLSIGENISVIDTLSDNIERNYYENMLASLQKYITNGGVTEDAMHQAFSEAVATLVTEETKEEIASSISAARSAIETAEVSIKESIQSAKNSADEAKKALADAETIKDEAESALANANTALNNANAALSNAEDAVKARNEIIGDGYTYEHPAEKSVLQEMRDIKAQVDTFTSDNGSLEQAISAAETAKNVKNIVVGETGDADEPIEGSALFKVLSAESNAAGSASSAFNSAEEATKARNEILGSGDNVSYTDPANNSALKEIRDAKGAVDEFIKKGGNLDNALNAAEIASDVRRIIVGENRDANNPAEDSALKKVQDAQKAAVQARNDAEEFAKSANNGITVINDLKYNDPENALSAALSANQGRVLDESKLNLSGGTMTGPLSLSADPTEDNHAATKLYVDTHMPSPVTTTKAGVMSADDKKKLDGIEKEANKYTHPGTHPASMISEDDDRKFMTQSEKDLLSNLSSRLGNLRIVIADAVPDDADENTITIIRP